MSGSVYRVLPNHLHSTADIAAKFLNTDVGLSVSSIKIEAEIDPSIEFRPTLHGISSDKHIVCLEVIEQLWPPEIHNFILECRNNSIPVKLYCGYPAGTFPNVDTRVVQYATENGIALMEINPQSGFVRTLIGQPVSLSLGGLRKIKLQDFPVKYRGPLKNAIDTFKSGNPSKGCSVVYDELEQLSRRIGKKCSSIGAIRGKNPSINWETAAWHAVVEHLKTNIDVSVAKTPLLKSALLSRISGLTEYRNETGHKPPSVKKMIERDMSLKTRFETAVDELRKLAEAARPLRL